MTTGKIVDMDFDEYQALEALNSHGIPLILRSPAHFIHARKRKAEPTPNMLLGTAFHLAVLEPRKYRRLICQEPEFNKRTKQGREDFQSWKSTLPDGAIILDKEKVETVNAMRDAVMVQLYAAALLADGHPEKTMVWEENGIPCKARIDWICGAHKAVLDLKSAQDASEDAFKRACVNFGYHIQAAWYLRGAEMCGLPDRSFVFVVCESASPHGIALYELDEMALSLGWRLATEALHLYAECREAGEYPSYPREIQSLSLPPWAYK